jgi:hypothetical protein
VEKVEVASNEYINTQADIRQHLHEVIERYKAFKVRELKQTTQTSKQTHKHTHTHTHTDTHKQPNTNE